MTITAPRRPLIVGGLFILAAVSFGGASDGFSKVISETQDLGPVVFARYLPVLVVMLALRLPADSVRLLATRSPALQILRGAAPLLITILMILALRDMPLAEATVILFVGPFIVVLLSGLLLGERILITSWMGVCLGFGAVLCVIRPDFGRVSVEMLMAGGAALSYALFQLLSRKLTETGDNPTTTLLWTFLVGTVASAPFALAQWSAPSPEEWIIFALVGLTYGLCHYCFAHGFSRAPANVLAPLSYFQVIAAAGFGYLAFGDVPDRWTVVGIVLIILAGLLTVSGRD